MSTSIHKIVYTCQCGYNYGSCGHKQAIILKRHHTSGVDFWYTTSHHPHPSTPENNTPSTTHGLSESMGYEEITALTELLNNLDKYCINITEPLYPLTEYEIETMKAQHVI